MSMQPIYYGHTRAAVLGIPVIFPSIFFVPIRRSAGVAVNFVPLPRANRQALPTPKKKRPRVSDGRRELNEIISWIQADRHRVPMACSVLVSLDE